MPNRLLFYTPPPGPRVAARGDTPSYRTPMRYPEIPLRQNISILSKWSTHVLEIKNLSIPSRLPFYPLLLDPASQRGVTPRHTAPQCGIQKYPCDKTLVSCQNGALILWNLKIYLCRADSHSTPLLLDPASQRGVTPRHTAPSPTYALIIKYSLPQITINNI